MGFVTNNEYRLRPRIGRLEFDWELAGLEPILEANFIARDLLVPENPFLEMTLQLGECLQNTNPYHEIHDAKSQLNFGCCNDNFFDLFVLDIASLRDSFNLFYPAISFICSRLDLVGEKGKLGIHLNSGFRQIVAREVVDNSFIRAKTFFELSRELLDVEFAQELSSLMLFLWDSRFATAGDYDSELRHLSSFNSFCTNHFNESTISRLFETAANRRFLGMQLKDLEFLSQAAFLHPEKLALRQEIALRASKMRAEMRLQDLEKRIISSRSTVEFLYQSLFPLRQHGLSIADRTDRILSVYRKVMLMNDSRVKFEEIVLLDIYNYAGIHRSNKRFQEDAMILAPLFKKVLNGSLVKDIWSGIERRLKVP